MSDLAACVAAMAREARPYLPTDAETLELARNVAAVLVFDGSIAVDEIAREMIAHRVQHFALRVGDIEGTARVMGIAWRRVAGRIVSEEVAA